jgi:hypothetical protein
MAFDLQLTKEAYEFKDFLLRRLDNINNGIERFSNPIDIRKADEIKKF